jgi:hypothetical protein
MEELFWICIIVITLALVVQIHNHKLGKNLCGNISDEINYECSEYENGKVCFQGLATQMLFIKELMVMIK